MLFFDLADSLFKCDISTFIFIFDATVFCHEELLSGTVNFDDVQQREGMCIKIRFGARIGKR